LLFLIETERLFNDFIILYYLLIIIYFIIVANYILSVHFINYLSQYITLYNIWLNYTLLIRFFSKACLLNIRLFQQLLIFKKILYSIKPVVKIITKENDKIKRLSHVP